MSSCPLVCASFGGAQVAPGLIGDGLQNSAIITIILAPQVGGPSMGGAWGHVEPAACVASGNCMASVSRFASRAVAAGSIAPRTILRIPGLS